MATAIFGFGSNASGGSGTPISVSTVEELTTELGGNVDGKIIELQEGTYDFRGLSTPLRKFTIHGERTTIRGKAQASVILQNFQFLIDLDKKNRLVIENIAFRSDGVAKGTPDGFDLVATVPGSEEIARTERSSIRFTQCSFDGHADIAIDSHNVQGQRRLLVTVDHCLFFDSRPGLPGAENADFVNRGATNVDVERENKRDPRQPGNSKFTVANNVFIDVWRRSPRIAEDNFGHIFNNLLYRWGYTAPGSLNPNDGTWRGMEVGGGESNNTGKNGTAVIQANRFIPWEKKADPLVAIKAHDGATVNYGGALPNRYDDPQGNTNVELSNPFVPGADVNLAQFYADEDIDVPPVTPANAVDWQALLEEVGPDALRVTTGPDTLRGTSDPRADLRKVLVNARTAVGV